MSHFHLHTYSPSATPALWVRLARWLSIEVVHWHVYRLQSFTDSAHVTYCPACKTTALFSRAGVDRSLRIEQCLAGSPPADNVGYINPFVDRVA